ncbi:hypothetical protein SK128_010794 [Halocaridina rubra]|uniref:Uncharacterized protein n=1 Tax=Halocaridina rubra TaxID=373956 RepID=A0AAN8WG46_HALRR
MSELDIAESVQYAHQAREIKRSEAFTVTADAELNCNLTHNNTKKWEIFAVNASADDALIAPVIIENT